MRSSRSPFALLALGLFSVFLVLSVAKAAYETTRSLWDLYLFRGEPPLQERARAYGPVYVDQIETIRRTIPRDGAYVLINGRPDEEGGPLWVKFDLAPRRAIYLGYLGSIDDVERLKKRIPRAARWVVIAYGSYERPVLIERYKFVQSLKERQGA